jgi:hypothetical protein
MSRSEDVQELIGEIKKNLQVFSDLEAFLARAQDNELKLLGRTQSAALIVAGILENSYTCLETMFMRISQFFENNLKPQKWHKELLRKMTLRIAGTREAVLSDKAYGILAELLRFRHFKRYYFEIDYDWDRLDFLMKKLDQLAPIIRQDIAAFTSFLERI